MFCLRCSRKTLWTNRKAKTAISVVQQRLSADVLASYDAFVFIVSAVIIPLPPACQQMKPMLPRETLFVGLEGPGNGNGQGGGGHDLRHACYILPDLRASDNLLGNEDCIAWTQPKVH
jgi:hypothetical protein